MFEVIAVKSVLKGCMSHFSLTNEGFTTARLEINRDKTSDAVSGDKLPLVVAVLVRKT
jgi:hypothetical protein